MERKKRKNIGVFLLLGFMLSMQLATAGLVFAADPGDQATASYAKVATGSDGKDYCVFGSSENIIYHLNGQVTTETGDSSLHMRMFTLTQPSQGADIGYCIQWGTQLEEGATYYAKEEEAEAFISALDSRVYQGMKLATTYGYAPGKVPIFPECNEADWFAATQIILWEYQQGLRKSPTEIESRSGMDQEFFHKNLVGRPGERYYQYILNKSATHFQVPSFVSHEEAVLPYNEGTKDFRLVLEDTSKVDNTFQFEGHGLTVTREGFSYTLVAKEPLITEEVLLSHDTGENNNLRLIWNDGQAGQKLITGFSDDFSHSFSLRTEGKGKGQIKKISEDDIVSNITFVIQKENGEEVVATTDEKGIITLDLYPGTYQVTEQVSPKYLPVEPQELVVREGETSEITFDNKLKKGSVVISKSDIANGKVISDCGIEILDENKKKIIQGRTDEEGKVTFDQLPVGTYYFREFDAPEGYQLDSTPYLFEIKEDGEVVKCAMTNEKVEVKSVPLTGDGNKLTFFGGLIAMSAGFLSLIYVGIKK